MSRSRHTDPRRVLAARRVRAPRQPRGAAPLPQTEDWPLPRVISVPARPGFLHPLDRADLQAALRLLGEECCYGLKSVELTQQPEGDFDRMALGRLLVPGRILLYEQPVPPWLVLGRVPGPLASRFGKFGAVLEALPSGTNIEWPDQSLRRFMLLDVLVHEVSHHLLQQYTGKRSARVARTADQEAFATLYAAQLQPRLAALA